MDLPDFSNLHVLVVGDVMLDRYWHGDTSRISPEAPVPVIRVEDWQERPGGAGNVALNLAALGCQVTLLSLIGDDLAADSLSKLLQSPLIEQDLIRLDDFPTVTKVRVVGRSQQLIRIDFEQSLPEAALQTISSRYRQHLAKAQVVIVSDYGKGNCRHARELIAMARKKGIPALVDPKSEDFGDYAGATVITPNRKELNAVIGRSQTEQGLAEKVQDLIKRYAFDTVLLTRGEHGMSIYRDGLEPVHLPTQAREVYDVTGAGDTVIAVLAAALAKGEAIKASANLANVAAGIVVRKLGAASISLAELRRALQRRQHAELGVLNEEQLLRLVEDAKAHNETVVMTNGCFDILHAGHISYLEEAKELGKRLIVAINDDDSVRRLKGSERPINELRQRMMVVAALRSVDWVIAFSEDTPARLIEAVKPDILVKAGDYSVTEIAGSEFVQKSGGEVKILHFLDGYSSSGIIDKIKTTLTAND